MKRAGFIIFALIAITTLLIFSSVSKKSETVDAPLWKFQAVDTMKYSRDVSREKLNDSSFDIVINNQMKEIAAMGATHVGIATPYDEEFLPILKRWVKAARRHNLSVWYRGNWSGWEGWFGYPKIDRQTHIDNTGKFIISHPELFSDGDVFSACPECENGGPGDPRLNGDPEGHRKFLIDEYKVTTDAFKKIGKKVDTRYNSMNGDVAELIMDRETTKALGGLVVVDHYVKSPDELAADIVTLANNSGGEVVLGEYGAPILDIHGQMTEDEQALWIQDAMTKLVSVRPLVGMSYWVNVGGSTSLFNDDGTARKAVSTLRSFYSPEKIELHVTDPLGGKIENVTVQTLNRKFVGSGTFSLPVIGDAQRAVVSAEGYKRGYATIRLGDKTMSIVLVPERETTLYRFRRFLRGLFSI